MRNHALMKKMLAGVLAVLTVACAAPVTAVNGGGFADGVAIVAKAANILTGTCDSSGNATFSLNRDTGELTISSSEPTTISGYFFFKTSGAGTNHLREVEGYQRDDNDNNIISDYDKIKSVEIKGKITGIGPAAFGTLNNLERVIIGEGVTALDLSAFRDCNNLKYVEIPSTMQSIGDCVFSAASNSLEIVNKSSVILVEKNFETYKTKIDTTDNVIKITQEGLSDEQTIAYLDLFNNAVVNDCKKIPANMCVAPNNNGRFDLNILVAKTADFDENNLRFGLKGKDPVNGTLDETNYVQHTISCVAKEMADNIDVKIYRNVNDKNYIGYLGSVSMKEYLVKGIQSSESAWVQCRPAAKAMLNYGAAAQTMFGYQTANLANDTTAMTDDEKTAYKSLKLSDYVTDTDVLNADHCSSLTALTNALNTACPNANLKFNSVNLNLGKDTGIILYYRRYGNMSTDEIATMLTNSMSTSTNISEIKRNNDSFIEIRLNPVGIKNLMNDQKIMYNGSEVTVNVKNYIARIAAIETKNPAEDTTNGKIVNACKALVAFYNASQSV